MVESTGFIIFSIYLLIWVTSFVNGGWFETFQDAKLEYKEIMTYALVITLCVTPIAGKMADLIPPYILIPACCIVRGAGSIMFKLIEEPHTQDAKIISTIFMISSYVQRVAIDSLLMRRLPRQIRALVVSLDDTIGLIGSALFTLFCGYAFDKYGPSFPFVVIGSLDILYTVIVLIAVCRGQLRN